MQTRTLDREFGKRVYDWLGEHSSVYRAIRWSVCFGRERFLQETAMDAMSLKPGDTVLDLACGAGTNLAFLEATVGPEGRIIAADYSAGMLARARAAAKARGWRNIEFIEADAAELSLASRSLDGAICTFALSAMPGELAALRRVAEALKPGARFGVLDAKAFYRVGCKAEPCCKGLCLSTQQRGPTKRTCRPCCAAPFARWRSGSSTPDAISSSCESSVIARALPG